MTFKQLRDLIDSHPEMQDDEALVEVPNSLRIKGKFYASYLPLTLMITVDPLERMSYIAPQDTLGNDDDDASIKIKPSN